MSNSNCQNKPNPSSSASNLIIQSELSQQLQYQQSDLVPLNWLQGSDIINISPLDQEEDAKKASTSVPPTFRIRNKSVIAVSQAHPVTVNPGYPLIVTTAPSFSNQTVVNAFDDSNVKPGISYTHLICMAIESSPNKCMTVQEIYNWCQKHYSYFRNSSSGWKNSLRHNLSINKYFKKLPRDVRTESVEYRLLYGSSLVLEESCSDEANQGPGRGNFWTIDPNERSNLLESIRRAPPLPAVRSIAFQPITTISTQFATINPLPTSTGSLIITSAPVAENRTPPQTHVDLVPEEESARHPAPLPLLESESIGAAEICGQEALPLPVGFEPWPSKEEEEFEETRKSFFGPMGMPISANVTLEPVKETKNRRKSSLQTNQLSCDRCKENQILTCRFCSFLRQMRKIGCPKDVLSSLGADSELGSIGVDQVLNLLDDDQEAPPSNWSKVIETRGETFIVKAPHMDHEYCYLQQHLRSLEDKRRVQLVNDELRAQQVKLLREIAGMNYDMEGLSFEDERENEEPKATKRHVRGGVKSRFKTNGAASVSKRKAKEASKKVEYDDDEDDIFEMPPDTKHYRSRIRYTAAASENDTTRDYGDDDYDMEEDGYQPFSRRATPSSSLSWTRKRRHVEGSENPLHPPSSRRRIQERTSQPPSEFSDVSPSPSRQDGGSKTNKNAATKLSGSSDADAAETLTDVTPSDPEHADQSPFDLGRLKPSRSSEASLVASISS